MNLNIARVWGLGCCFLDDAPLVQGLIVFAIGSLGRPEGLRHVMLRNGHITSPTPARSFPEPHQLNAQKALTNKLGKPSQLHMPEFNAGVLYLKLSKQTLKSPGCMRGTPPPAAPVERPSSFPSFPGFVFFLRV